MAEPQPSNVHEGIEPPDAPPANAEDRKAAAALSALDVKGGDDGSAAPKRDVDLKALNDAIKNLDVAGGKTEKKGTADVPAKKKADEPAKPLLKLDPADVTLVSEQLDLSKTKATELLRAHDANVVKAMTAWITTVG